MSNDDDRIGPNGLSRPRDGRLIAGVCAGLARRFGVPALAVRALFLLLVVLPPSSLLVYLVLWLIMPNER